MVYDPVIWMAEYMGSGSVHCVCIELYMTALDSSGCAYKYHNIVYTRDSIPLMDWNSENRNPNTDSESITPHSTMTQRRLEQTVLLLPRVGVARKARYSDRSCPYVCLFVCPSQNAINSGSPYTVENASNAYCCYMYLAWA